jgi:hypothetical protein
MDQPHTLEIAYLLIRFTLLMVVVVTGQELYFEMRDRWKIRRKMRDDLNGKEL